MKRISPFNRQFDDIVEGLMLAFMSILWWAIIVVAVEKAETLSFENLIKLLTLAGASIGVCVAVWKIFIDQKWRQSEAYLEQAKELFEKSFEALTGDEDADFPVNSRRVWLVSSRLLLAANELGEKISDLSHKTTFNEYKEYWRGRFHELLDPHGDKSPGVEYYFEEGALHSWSDGRRPPIVEVSLAVIYRFIAWPKGKVDRLAEVEVFSGEEIDQMTRLGPHGLAEYCKKRRELVESRARHV